MEAIMVKQNKFGLISKLILGIVIGVIAGSLKIPQIIRIFLTFNAIFGELLKFTVPLIITAFITKGIAELGQNSKKILGTALLFSYSSSVLMGIIALFININLFPKLISSSHFISLTDSLESLKPFFSIGIPPIFSVTTALVLSLVLGIGISQINNSYLKNVFDEFNSVISKFLQKIIVPFLPLYISGVFADMAYTGKALLILKSFLTVFVLVLLIQIGVILLLFTVTGILVRKNPFKLIQNMLPAYMTAIGTQSSVATIPLTVSGSIQNGVSKKMAEFIASLCANIHMPGSIISLTSCSLAVMLMFNQTPSVSGMIPFIMMLSIMTVAAPGIPGGAVVASLGVLQTMLGFDQSMLALIVALHVAQDSFGTACNVTGDGAIALIIDHMYDKKITDPELIIS